MQITLKKLNGLDPIVWFLRSILQGFLKGGLGEEDLAFVEENVTKHRVALWTSLLSCVFVLLGLRDTPAEAIPIVISCLLAPVMVLGGAWFAISFGGVPKNLISVAMTTTLWMFTAFLASLSAMFISAGFVTSPYLWPVLALIYIGVIIGCVQYDTADGLKAGLDGAVLRQARYATEYYKKQGIELSDESS